MYDRVEIRVRSGRGGDGSVSFRREKYVPFGGPDGGDGGRGGDVVVLADPETDSLRYYKPRALYRAGNGGNGRSQKKHGRNGADLVVKVPPGTIVLNRDLPRDEGLLADCDIPSKREVIAAGGQGGKGNTHYASSTNQAPRIAQKGEDGEELTLVLEMRLIADVGITGFPNAGKSTLLAAASAARPKIASYPFTTLEPALGVVEVGLKTFVMADIPGLIDGAHLGRGLGHDFLRHIMRTRVLIHLIDGSAGDPVESLLQVNEELRLFDPALGRKPQLVVVNKTDLPQVYESIEEIRRAFKEAGTSIHFISAATGEGVPQLMSETLKMLEKASAEMESEKKAMKAVFRPGPEEQGASVIKEADAYIIKSRELERIVARVDMNSPEVRRQVQRQFDRLKVDRALQKAGAQPGDKIRCGSKEWEY